jgi:glycosyltransferase involved in cell wall biosynthesis
MRVSNNRPRVVILGAKGLPGVDATGGVERGVEQLTNRLARVGVRCIVYERADRRGWRRTGRTLVRQLPFLDSKNHACWTHTVLASLDYLGYRRRHDVIHLHNVQNASLSVLFRLLRHRVIFHMHGQEWRVAKWGPVMSFFMKLSVPPMMATANVIATVCAPSRRLLAARFPWSARRIVLVPNGLPVPTGPSVDEDLVLNEYGLTARRYFLYSGRLVPQKRVELVIRALAQSRLPYPLVIAGAGSHSTGYVRRLHDEVQACGLTAQVQFVGQLEWTRLLPLYVNCRAVVQPSDSEGCSNTLLEAVAATACVICTDLPENRAVMGSAALYTARGDSRALAAAMETLQSEQTLDRLRSLTSERQRLLHTWDDIAEQFLNLYWPLRGPRDERSAERVPVMVSN